MKTGSEPLELYRTASGAKKYYKVGKHHADNNRNASSKPKRTKSEKKREETKDSFFRDIKAKYVPIDYHSKSIPYINVLRGVKSDPELMNLG